MNWRTLILAAAAAAVWAGWSTAALAQAAGGKRNLVTDEPRAPKGKPEGAPEYEPMVEPGHGRHLALTMQKLERGFDPARPFLIWALGSSYTNMLGNGEMWREEIPQRFPSVREVEYRKMVGNACPWQYLPGWARHLVTPDQPDLVLIYTIGDPADLESVILEVRRNTTADIIVPSIHWRERDQELWGVSENAADQDVAAVRAVCARHGVEFVENRRDWGHYLEQNGLPISALLKDAVHQSDYGAAIINRNILAHLRKPESFSYDPAEREIVVEFERGEDGVISAGFAGNRIDLCGVLSAAGGEFAVFFDGMPAGEAPVFQASYVQPDSKNSRAPVGGSPTVPRDSSPHGVTLGENIKPQSWTIEMTSDKGDYRLTGSLTGPDGAGNAFADFTSESGQIRIEAALWRRAERNRKGDKFTFDVTRATLETVNFAGKDGEVFVRRLAVGLPNQEHRLELRPLRQGEAGIRWMRAFRPPGR
jgi:hypothetical protein